MPIGATLRGLVNTKRPIGRLHFGIIQFLSLSLTEALLPHHDLSRRQLVLLVVGSISFFGFWGITVAKRLLDIGWPRPWALLALAPAIAFVLKGWSGAERNTASAVFPTTIFLLGVA